MGMLAKRQGKSDGLDYWFESNTFHVAGSFPDELRVGRDTSMRLIKIKRMKKISRRLLRRSLFLVGKTEHWR